MKLWNLLHKFQNNQNLKKDNNSLNPMCLEVQVVFPDILQKLIQFYNLILKIKLMIKKMKFHRHHKKIQNKIKNKIKNKIYKNWDYNWYRIFIQLLFKLKIR